MNIKQDFDVYVPVERVNEAERNKANLDLLAYGSSFLFEDENGNVKRVSPEDVYVGQIVWKDNASS